MTPVIVDAWSLQGITVARDDHTILTDITLDIPQGEITAIVGASGSGKSSLLKVLAGQLQPLRGRIAGEFSGNNFPIHGQAWRSMSGPDRLAEISELTQFTSTALLVDEPTKAVAPDISAKIHERLLSAADSGVTIVIVTHEHRWVEQSLDRAVVVADQHCRYAHPTDIDFLSIQHATMERLRTQ